MENDRRGSKHKVIKKRLKCLKRHKLRKSLQAKASLKRSAESYFCKYKIFKQVDLHHNKKQKTKLYFSTRICLLFLSFLRGFTRNGNNFESVSFDNGEHFEIICFIISNNLCHFSKDELLKQST